MKKRLYAAYGSNLNLQQMNYRCPTAQLYRTGLVRDYELQFKGHPHSAFATIAPKKGASVPVAVWELQPRDERALDQYEGYPRHYFKQDIPVRVGGQDVTAMVYIMNLKMDYGLPSRNYYQTVLEGYKNCGLDSSLLEQALLNSTQQYFMKGFQQTQQESLFQDYEESTFDEVEEQDISDPFYFSEGLHL